MKYVILGLGLLALTACADGRFVEAGMCMPDGSPVVYQYKNTQGTYDGSKLSAENCK